MTPLLYHMDARSAAAHMDDASIDLIISGPPYYDHLTYSADIGNLSNTGLTEYLAAMRALMGSLAPKLKDGGIVAFWVHDIYHSGNPTNLVPLHAYLADIMPEGIVLRHILIWDRYLKKYISNLPTGDSYGTRIQYVLVFSKGTTRYEDVMTRLYWHPIWYFKTTPRVLGSKTLYRGVFALSTIPVIERLLRPLFDRSKKIILKDSYTFDIYKTTCPPEIAGYLVALFSKPGDTVLDPFAGSGTSLRVAHTMGRQAIGCEINGEAVAVIARTIPEIIVR